ncbi:hypothetical protein HG537_0C02190 [Torulaspora globosa]|uniref:Uncharacterized protein n=1 Tax=Torulaspora globosa TaxID=48254 RepID=A0A7H9HT91_9SACH|nr:hypothetical protein HG537_0C02190 [Torulaspora sp. CBS 2947]
MLVPTLRISPSLLTKTVSTRTFSLAAITRLPHQKTNLSPEERNEQKLFDENKARLEKLEQAKIYDGSQRETCEELKKKGDDARIEQNRPDDGVY